MIQTDSIVDMEQYTNIFESLGDRESPIRTIASEVRNRNPPIIRPITFEEDIKFKNVFTQCGMLQNLCVSPTNRPSTEPYAMSRDEPPDACMQCEEFVSMDCSSLIIRPSTFEATDELLPVDVVYTYTEARYSKKQQVPSPEDAENDLSLSFFPDSIGKQLVISPRSEQSL